LEERKQCSGLYKPNRFTYSCSCILISSSYFLPHKDTWYYSKSVCFFLLTRSESKCGVLWNLECKTWQRCHPAFLRFISLTSIISRRPHEVLWWEQDSANQCKVLIQPYYRRLYRKCTTFSLYWFCGREKKGKLGSPAKYIFFVVGLTMNQQLDLGVSNYVTTMKEPFLRCF
jgi:hypothetical protein